MTSATGTVYLVGAGPGDPGLITLRGAELLRRADVVLYDYLASPEIVALARPDAERICLGRHGRGRLMSQAEINDTLVRHAREGRTVVRLKGGDPSIFARVAEEVAALESAAIPFEIIPGVTAAQAASAYGGIPLTQRDDASCVAFVTGHQSADQAVGEPLDYAALARFPGTLVFYMGITTVDEWSSALIKFGKRADTPVAIVRRASLPDQQVLFSTLSELSEFVKQQHIRPPAIVIVGDVARNRDVPSWWTSRPLFGRTVLVTRPEHQAEELACQLRELGANVLCQPAIEIGEPADWSAVDAVIERIAEFNWLVFSSANGVDYFFRRLLALGRDVRSLGHARLAVIGPGTAAALSQYHLKADLQPESFRAEDLAESLRPHVRGQRVLLVRASRGREVLAEMLSDAGGIVEQAVVYQSRDVSEPSDEIAAALAAGQIDWTVVTSSAIARSLIHLFGDELRQTRLAAISPLTAEELAKNGHPPQVVAATYTMEGILAAILAAEA